MSGWVKSHWKKILQYLFFAIIALFGSLLDALSFFSHLLSGASFPAFPKLGGISVDLIASIVGIVGLVYLVMRDTGKVHLVLKPSNRVRFSFFALSDVVLLAVFLWGTDFLFTSSPQLNPEFSFLATAGFMIGAIGTGYLTIDIVGSLQGRWTTGGLVGSILHEIVNPSPTRTQAMTDFISLLYQFHSSWVNIWEPAVRLRSLQATHASAFADLMSKLISTRANIRAEGTRITSESNSGIDQLLKRGGELSAYLPTMVEVSKHGKVEPLDDAIIKKITESGNYLSMLVHDTIIPTLERRFVVRRERTGL